LPEGAEVKIISESLDRALQGRAIVGINYLYGRYTKHGPPEGHAEISSVLPQNIAVVSCKGKFIYIQLQNEWSIWNTLGMTGSWSSTLQKHSRAQLHLDDGSSVYFNDIRNFGTLKYVHGQALLQKKLKSIGPDMLAEDVDDATFITRIRTKNSRVITESLMDQTIVSGVGNYLKSECLYFAGISPHRACSSISDQALSRLNNTIKAVIRQSYKTGGATIYTFQNFEGEKGQYTSRFAVYNQKTDPKGNEVLSFTSPEGRTTFWVPEEQS
jgi:formamidopyrimidine-DNA glycosylase